MPFPAETYESSGEKTEGAVAIKAEAGFLGGVLVITNGTDDATVILYDDPDSANGDKLFEAVVAGGDNYGGAMFPLPVPFVYGCWAVIGGTGSSCIVYYQ